MNIYKLPTKLVLRGTPSIFYSLFGCMSPLHVKNKEETREKVEGIHQSKWKCMETPKIEAGPLLGVC